MSTPWQAHGASAPSLPSGTALTLVEGRTFSRSSGTGDMYGHTHGLFHLDTRFVHRLELTIDGAPPEALTSTTPNPFSAVFVARAERDDETEPDTIVIRRREIGRGMRDVIELRNPSGRPRVLDVAVTVDADFAHLFDVKGGRTHGGPSDTHHQGTDDGVRFTSADASRGVEIRCDPPPTRHEGRTVGWTVELAPRAAWELRCDLVFSTLGSAVTPTFAGADAPAAVPARRLERWRGSLPSVDSDDVRLCTAVAQAFEDLGALRIFNLVESNNVVVAAGAPWFMTLFGRDSLLTSWMALPFAPELARGVLNTLAVLQGDRTNAGSEQEPGKILHEIRTVAGAGTALADESIYYGTVDATPLFVVLLAEAWRWGAVDDDAARRLLRNADRAMAWMRDHGDADGDGFIEYRRQSAGGLDNQGWKDSWDGISFGDGRLPEPPIALVEVQGYAYAAYLAAADLHESLGDPAVAGGLRSQAEQLRQRFEAAFWLPDRRLLAVGLDGANAPIDSVASNMGHCLWSGILGTEVAEAVVAALGADDMFSGWGVRTLATSEARYDPLSYHNGSVWPHDNAIIVAGLTRPADESVAHRVIDGMLDAAASRGGRLPELFSGLARDDVPAPVDYPSSCSPQAWSSATPLSFVRYLLGLEADAPPGTGHGRTPPAPVDGSPRRERHPDRGVAAERAGRGWGGLDLGDRRRPRGGRRVLRLTPQRSRHFSISSGTGKVVLRVVGDPVAVTGDGIDRTAGGGGCDHVRDHRYRRVPDGRRSLLGGNDRRGSRGGHRAPGGRAEHRLGARGGRRRPPSGRVSCRRRCPRPRACHVHRRAGRDPAGRAGRRRRAPRWGAGGAHGQPGRHAGARDRRLRRRGGGPRRRLRGRVAPALGVSTTSGPTGRVSDRCGFGGPAPPSPRCGGRWRRRGARPGARPGGSVPWAIWVRQLNPSAGTRVSGSAARTAGSSTRAPAALDTSC